MKKNRTEKFRYLGVLLILVFYIIGRPDGLNAQGDEALIANFYEDELQKELAENDADGYLDKIVTLEEGQQYRLDILKSIALQSDLELSYSQQFIPANDEIIIDKDKKLSVEEALWEVLEGTLYRFGISESGQLVLLKMIASSVNQNLQTGNLTGRVIDGETGDPMPAANIYIEETRQGASSNAEGEFEINDVETGTHEVSVTFIGYDELVEEVEVQENQTTEVTFELIPSSEKLDEVVVTGYSLRERSEVTGAISSIGSDDIQARAIQTPDQAIQGSSAGTQMVGSSGQPGASSNVRIRGTGSIHGGNDPLYIVDGVPMENYYRSDIGTTGTNVLVGLNPSDIESIEVLRDAEATAIYGAQGANGVILIKTREGREGPTNFTASMRTGVHEMHKEYDLMDGPEFVSFMQEAYANRYEDLGRTEYNNQEYGNPEEAGAQAAIDEFGHPDQVGTNDWFGAMTRPGSNQRYNISAEGGTADTRFYISGGYEDHQGTVLSSTFDRASLKTNFDHDATDWLSFETKVNLSKSQYNGQAETSGNWINSPFHGGVTTRVTTPIYNDDGTYNQDIPGVMYNNVQLLKEEERIGREYQVIGNLAATVDVSSQLAVRGQYNMDLRIARDRRYNNPVIDRYNNYGGSVYERTREVQNYSGNLVADYINSFSNVHNINTIFGAEYRMRDYRFHAADGEQLPNPLLGQLNLAGVASAVSGRTSEYKTAGVFSRLKYNFDERYHASINLRYDGHSRFGADKRWGMFYSGALAWDISQEAFVENADWLNELRPRVSYGITGNASIGDFESTALFGSGGTYQGETGLRPQQLGNAQLSWEQARSIDLAVDYTVFNDRVYGSIGVYRTDNEELLLERWLPSDSGFGDIMENVGSVRNEGLEAELGAVLLDAGEFVWSSDFNITFHRSEVLELEGDQDWMSDPSISASRIIVGEPRHQWWVRNYAGVNPADGRALFFDEDGNLTNSVGSDDYHAAGSMEPDFYGGWKNTLSYKNISLDMFFQYEFGSKILDEQYSNFHLAPHRGRALSPDMWRRWTQPGDITDIPKAYSESSFPGGTSHNLWSDRRLYDGSYIRLKSVSVNYQVPNDLASKISLKGATIFARAENLVTWTEYPGLDPEVFDRGQTFYPQPRTIEGGIEINF